MADSAELTVYPIREYHQREMLHGVGEDDAAKALAIIADGKADDLYTNGEEWIARVGNAVYAAVRSKRTNRMVLYAWPKGTRPEAQKQYNFIVEGYKMGGFYT